MKGALRRVSRLILYFVVFCDNPQVYTVSVFNQITQANQAWQCLHLFSGCYYVQRIRSITHNIGLLAVSTRPPLGGLNQKLKRFCRGAHGELTAKKWLDSIDKQKRSNLKFCDRRTDRQTDRQADRVNC